MEVEGEVVRKRVSPGSKSDRMAIVLVSGKEHFILHPKGGDSYTGQEALVPLLGKRIRAVGSVEEGHLFLERYQVLDPKT